MNNRQKLITALASDLFMLKRRIMSGHKDSTNCTVTPAQAQLMFLVKQHQKITTSEVAKMLAITTSAATQLIDALVEHGLLIREANNQDRRTYKIKISATAEEHMAKMKAEGLARMTKIFKVLDDDELNKLFELGRKIVTHTLEEEGGQDGYKQCDHS